MDDQTIRTLAVNAMEHNEIATMIATVLGYVLTSFLCSIADAILPDADATSPRWKRIASRTVSVLAKNIGRATNDSARQQGPLIKGVAAVGLVLLVVAGAGCTTYNGPAYAVLAEQEMEPGLTMGVERCAAHGLGHHILTDTSGPTRVWYGLGGPGDLRDAAAGHARQEAVCERVIEIQGDGAFTEVGRNRILEAWAKQWRENAVTLGVPQQGEE